MSQTTDNALVDFCAPNQTVLLAMTEQVDTSHVAILTLNRPQRLNSFIDAMHEDMRAALTVIERATDLRCLVITGAGNAFCSGQDLNSRYELLQQGEVNLGQSLGKHFNPLIERLQRLPMPMVCAMNGVAAGAGIGLALACDVIVAAEEASFVLAFAKVGLVPDAGSSWWLVQALGLARARALCLLGDTLTAAQARDCGLVYQTVPRERLAETTDTIVARLLANPALGQALTRRALLNAATSELTAQLQCEAQLQTVAGRSRDYTEAVNAFVEKRKPSFSGN